MKLTVQVISEIYPDHSLEDLKDLNASKKDIAIVEDLSKCKQLRKVNLSNNRLVDEKSINGLNDLKQMTLLNLSHNQFKDFTGFQHFTSLNGTKKKKKVMSYRLY
jgi:Leucine-rich repeat (LRR) protein